MRKITILAVALVAGSGSAPALSQSFMADIIGQSVSGYGAGVDVSCLTGKKPPKPESVAKAQGYTDAVFARYVSQAALGADVTKAFSHAKKFRDWTVDGIKQPVASGRDPWLPHGAKVIPIGFVQGNAKIRYRAMWKAVRSDGTLLGTYDGLLQREDGGARFLELALNSAEAAQQPKPLTMFCSFPGDSDRYAEEQTKRAANKHGKDATSKRGE